LRRLFCMSPYHDGHRNLAIDEYLLSTIGPDDFLLYLYVNRNAVIIGQNQNAWKECNTAKMKNDGVQLVRRVSGGGAVYHDLGNLNFSFIAGRKNYSVEKQLDMILSAVRDLGVNAEFSGRNDITVDGKKFSGNAFAVKGQNKQHHGTLLINANLTKMSDYLNVSAEKIRAKGVSSVRARVCNLNQYNSDLTVDMMASALKSAYQKHYGEFETLNANNLNEAEIQAFYEKHSSWEWQMGRAPVFDYEIDTRFVWGGVQIYLNVENGQIKDVQVYTDALDTDIPAQIKAALTGVRFVSESMADKLEDLLSSPEMHSLADYIRSLQL
jgi:lipoate-protein ligase A